MLPIRFDDNQKKIIVVLLWAAVILTTIAMVITVLILQRHTQENDPRSREEKLQDVFESSEPIERTPEEQEMIVEILQQDTSGMTQVEKDEREEQVREFFNSQQ